MTPTTEVAERPGDWSVAAGAHTWEWERIPSLPTLLLADGSGPARQQTQVRLVADADALYVRFDCADRDIWATYTERDDPIYDEEVVEVFLAPGAAVPGRYVEIEVSPAGVLFDALVDNPPGRPKVVGVDVEWSCRGIGWVAERDDVANHWAATLVLPWRSVAVACGAAACGSTADSADHLVWRANFYRIERPRDGVAEFSCWSPTLTEPANFHRPERFGTLAVPR